MELSEIKKLLEVDTVSLLEETKKSGIPEKGYEVLSNLVDTFNYLTSEKFLRSGKIGRNAPCGCCSGKKYKHCCGKK